MVGTTFLSGIMRRRPNVDSVTHGIDRGKHTWPPTTESLVEKITWALNYGSS